MKLISAEGFEFVVDKKAAMVSKTIRNMLTSPGDNFKFFWNPFACTQNSNQFRGLADLNGIGNFSEAQLGEVTFPEISTPILEKICQYFYWHLQFARQATSTFICIYSCRENNPRLMFLSLSFCSSAMFYSSSTVNLSERHAFTGLQNINVCQ